MDEDIIDVLKINNALKRIFEVDYGCSTSSDQEYTSDFKLLRIRNAKVPENVLEVFKKIYKDRNQHHHWFMTVVDIDNIGHIDAHMTVLNEYIDNARPLIFQWNSTQTKSSVIFFKTTTTDFKKLELNDRFLSEDDFINFISAKNSTFNLGVLLRALQCGLGGSFKGDLLKTSITPDTEFDQWRLIDYAARYDDNLSIRFLMMLSDWDLAKQNGCQQRTMEIAAEYASPETISALLDLPFSYDGGIFLTKGQQELLEETDAINKNTPLLIAAAKCESPATLKFFINSGADFNRTNQWGKRPMEMAWEQKRFDNVLVLLESDDRFPDKFRSEENDNLRKLVEERKKFHEAIEENSKEKVNAFIERNPRLKYAYNPSNQSALFTALKCKQYDMYITLRYKGYSNDKEQDVELTEEQKEKLKEANLKRFGKQNNSHILYLLSKSYLGINQEKCEFYETIMRYYKELDSVPQISTMLKVVEQSESLKIIFDFNNESVVDADPTQSSGTKGSCDFRKGHIYIGAKRLDKCLLGTLSHELTHLAMQVCYRNDCNPFNVFDKETEKRFEVIIKEYKNKPNKINKIIKRVFERYHEEDWASELIVRVNHLLAYYMKDQEDSKALPQKYNTLFDFYTENIECDFRNFIKNTSHFKALQNVQRFNDRLGIMSDLGNSIISIHDKFSLIHEISERKPVYIISTNNPILAKTDIYRTLEKERTELHISCYSIFVSCKHFANDQNCLEMNEAVKSSVKPTVIIDCTKDFDSSKKNMSIIKGFSEVIFIADAEISRSIKSALVANESKIIEKEYKWHCLAKDFQTKLLETQVLFQNMTVPLVEVISSKTEVLNCLPLNVIIDTKTTLTIGKPIGESEGYNPDYYINRALLSKETEIRYRIDTTNELQELFNRVNQTKVIIVSDIAGMGKTTFLTHMAKNLKDLHPSYWFVNINLNNHSDVFQLLNCDEFSTTEEAMEILVTSLIKLESEFDKALFKSMVENEKIVAMFDGFDEISPNYKKIVISLLEMLKRNSIGQIWVTTRPHIEKYLKEKLETEAFILETLSEKDQVEFLKTYWRKATEDIDDVKIDEFAKNLLQKFAKSIKDQKLFCGVPLHTRMLAEAFRNDWIAYNGNESVVNLPSQLDLQGLYEKFIEQKYQIYTSQKKTTSSSVASKGLGTIFKDGINLREVYQHLAVKSLFPDNDHIMKNIKPCEIPGEQLSSIGLTNSNESLSFIHRTFAEYFVAEYLFCQLKELHEPSEDHIDFFLTKILSESEYQIIQSFLDGFLRNSELPEATVTTYGNRTNILWQQECFPEHLMFRSAAENGNANIINFLFKSLKSVVADETIKKILLSAKHNTLWNIAAKNGNVEAFNKLWFWATELKIPSEDLKKILLTNDNYYCSFIFCVVRDLKILTAVLDKASNEIICKEDWREIFQSKNHHGETPWMVAVENRNLKVLTALYQFFQVLERDTRDFLLERNCEGRNSFFFAVIGGDLDTIEQLWRWGRDELHLQKVRDILFDHDNGGMTLWSLAAKSGLYHVLNLLIKLGSEVLSKPDDVMKVFLAFDRCGRTCWHHAANKTAILQYLFDWGRVISLSPEDIKNILLAKDYDGKTVISIATCELLERHKTMENLSESYNILINLWNWGDTSLTRDDFINLILFRSDCYSRSNWHRAVTLESPEPMRKLWEWSKQVLVDPPELKKLLLSKDDEGRTVWNLASSDPHSRHIDELWQFGKDASLNAADYMNILFDRMGCSLWHDAARTRMKSEGLLEKLWLWGKDLKLEEKFAKTLLLSEDATGKTAFLLAAECGSVSGLTKLWSWGEQFLNRQELEAMLFSRNHKGKTACQILAETRRFEDLQQIWSFAQKSQKGAEVFQEEDKYGHNLFFSAVINGYVSTITCGMWNLHDILLDHDNNGMNLWSLAAKSGRKHIVILLRELASEVSFSSEDVKKILLDFDNNGRSCLHYAASNTAILQYLFTWGSDACLCSEDIKRILLTADCNGTTVLSEAVFAQLEAKFTNTKEVTEVFNILNSLWNWGGTSLTKEEFKNLLLCKNLQQDGLSIWYAAAKNQNEELIKQLWEWCKKILIEPVDLKMLLLSEDDQGRTVWSYAASNNKSSIFYILWQFGKDASLTAADYRKISLEYCHYSASPCDDILKEPRLCGEDVDLAPDFSKALLLCKDIKGHTAFLLAAESGSVSGLTKLWSLGEQFLNPLQLEAMLFSRNHKGKTAFQMLAETGNLKGLQKIWSFAQILQKGVEIIKDNSFFFAVSGGHLGTIEQLWQWGRGTLSPQDVRNILFDHDNDGMTLWSLAAKSGHKHVLKLLRKLAGDVSFSSEDLKKILLDADKNGRTCLRYAARKLWILQYLLTWGNDACLCSEDIKKILLTKDCYGSSVLSEAFEVFAQQEDALKSKKSEKKAFEVFEILRILWKWGGTSLTKEDFTYFLLTPSLREGVNQTIWHEAATKKSSEPIRTLWKWSKQISNDPLYLKMLLFSKDSAGLTVWGKAAKYQSPVIRVFRDFGKDASLTPEDYKIILLEKDGIGRSVWYYLGLYYNYLFEDILFRNSIEQLEPDFLKTVLLLEDDTGHTGFLLVAKSGFSSSLRALLLWSAHSLNPQELRTMVSCKDHKGRTALHFLASKGRLECLQEIWLWAKNFNIDSKIFREMLVHTDVTGHTAFSSAIKSGSASCLMQLWKFAREFLDDSNLKSLISDNIRMVNDYGSCSDRSDCSDEEQSSEAWDYYYKACRVMELLWEWKNELSLEDEYFKNWSLEIMKSFERKSGKLLLENIEDTKNLAFEKFLKILKLRFAELHYETCDTKLTS